MRQSVLGRGADVVEHDQQRPLVRRPSERVAEVRRTPHQGVRRGDPALAEVAGAPSARAIARSRRGWRRHARRALASSLADDLERAPQRQRPFAVEVDVRRVASVQDAGGDAPLGQLGLADRALAGDRDRAGADMAVAAPCSSGSGAIARNSRRRSDVRSVKRAHCRRRCSTWARCVSGTPKHIRSRFSGGALTVRLGSAKSRAGRPTTR